jgi:hypothetical protein
MSASISSPICFQCNTQIEQGEDLRNYNVGNHAFTVHANCHKAFKNTVLDLALKVDPTGKGLERRVNRNSSCISSKTIFCLTILFAVGILIKFAMASSAPNIEENYFS